MPCRRYAITSSALHSARIEAADSIMPTGKRSLSSLSLDRGMSFVNRIPGSWKGGRKMGVVVAEVDGVVLILISAGVIKCGLRQN